MAQTKLERIVGEINTNVALLIERQEHLYDTHQKLKVDVGGLKKTVYENGLNSKVEYIYTQIKKLEDAQGAIRMETVKASLNKQATVTISVITGTFSLIGIIVTYLLK